MDIEVIGFFLAIVFLLRAILLKVYYRKNYAICLQYKTTNMGCVSHILYEYEIIERGEKVIYRNWGTAFFVPTKGKRYKILISKSNCNKVVGYNEFIIDVCIACVVMSCVAIMLFF